jgi:hypothetical protein
MIKHVSTGLLAAAVIATVAATPAVGQPPDRPPVDVTITDVTVSQAAYHDIGSGYQAWGCVISVSASLSGINKGHLMAAGEMHTTDNGGQWYEIGWPGTTTLTRNQDMVTIVSGVWNPWEVPTLDSARFTVFSQHGPTRIVRDVDTWPLTNLYCAPEPESP